MQEKVKLKKNYAKIFGRIMVVFAQGFLVATLGTVLLGYILGFSGFLVVSGSSRPDIPIQSLIIDYKCSYSELQVGDYLTFSFTGKSQTTHRIVAIKPEGEYFEKGEEVIFWNNEVQYKYNVESKCQILTMASNFGGYEKDLEEFQKTNDPVKPSALVENVSYKHVKGKVIYIFPNIGKTLFFLRDNFVQIIFYVIILYLAMEVFKFVPYYIRAF